MSNLIIQNYASSIINQRKAAQSSNDPAIAALKVNAKPYEPKGRLIKSNIFESTKYAVKKPFQELKFFKDAVQGKGDDYSIGRINDVGIKLGSLGIAAILSATAASPFKKGMEFVGLATWFGSMALWPKIIGSAVKFTKGFDPTQKYEDSYGRVKSLTQDPQYICWELLDDKTLNHVADKNGIPKNIENREEAARKKIQQISTQSNTLAMLTAGFATPILSSLIADQAGKKVIDPMVERVMIEKARQGFNKEIKVDDDAVALLKTALSGKTNIDTVTRKNISSELNNLFKNSNISEQMNAQFEDILSSKTIGSSVHLDKKLLGEIRNIFGEKSNQVIDTILSKKDLSDADFRELVQKELGSLRKNNVRGMTPQILQDDLTWVKGNLSQDVLKKQLFDENLRTLLSRGTVEKLSADDMSVILKKAGDSALKYSDITLSEDVSKQVENLYKVTNTFESKMKRFKKFFKSTLQNVDGSATANNWKNAGPKLVKAFGFSNDELQLLAKQTTDPKIVDSIINRKLQDIISSSDKTAASVKQVLSFYTKSTAKEQRFANEALTYLDEISKNVVGDEESAKKLREAIEKGITEKEPATVFDHGFKKLASGMDDVLYINRHEVLNKVINTKASFSRPITTMNVYSKLSDLNNPELINLKNILFSKADGPESTKKVVDMIKDIMLHSQDASSYFNKFEQYGLNKPQSKKELQAILDFIFAPLSQDMKNHIPAKVAEDIDSNNAVLKSLVSTLENPIKPDLNMSPVEVFRNIKKTIIPNSIDDYMRIGWNDEDSVVKPAVESFRNYLKKDSKFDELLVLLKQEGADKGKILDDPKEFLKFFKKSAKNLLGRVDEAKGTHMQDEITKVLNSTINSWQPSHATIQDASAAAGQGLVHFIQESANNTVSYKTWLKRAGIAGLVLVGVTAIGIALMGRKNKYNTDTYEYKREVAANGK